MSPPRREDAIRHGRRALAASPASIVVEEDWSGAEEAKVEKLRRNHLQRRARTRGFQLRHSDYGYALIDTARRRVDDRSDMSLDEVESWLTVADAGGP